MTIVNDVTSWNITFESSVTLLESSIMHLKNIYSIGVTHDDHRVTIVKCLKYWPKDTLIKETMLNTA